MDPSPLTNLCFFGADVGSRLVRLAKWVDGMPSSVKSLGFEMWATCEVLCELAMILARAKKNTRVPYFNEKSLRDIEDYVETCDEVFHEAARGVLVAYERLRILREESKRKDAKAKKEKEAKQGENGDGLRQGYVENIKEQSKNEMIYLSFEERIRWPLFQGRVRSMMESLLNAKMDLTLHILVYWVTWEGECLRRSSVFSSLSPSDRVSLIVQLWESKTRREQEAIREKLPEWDLPGGSTGASTPPSIFNLSQAGSSTHSENGISSYSPRSATSTTTSEGVFKRIGRSFAKSSRKRLESIGFKSRKLLDDDELLVRRSPDMMPLHQNRFHTQSQSGQSNNSREASVTRQGSNSSSNSNSSNSSSLSGRDRPILRKAQSARPGMLAEQYSFLSSTEAGSGVHSHRPQMSQSKSSTWCAGPTKSAKEGILREWEELRNNPDDLVWQNEEGELGNSRDPRELGRRLLFTQLSAMTPFWAVPDTDEQEAATVMLLERWIEPGALRSRVTAWEDIVQQRPRFGEGQQRHDGNTEELVMKFHFGR